MRSTNRKRSLLVSGAVVLLAMTVIVGMTWALFTDTQKVINHLQAGDLEITLKRMELTKTKLNAAGYLVTPSEPDKTVVNFSNPTDKNVFGIEPDERIVPESKYVAKMEIQNKSDVAFGYWIEIVCTDKTNGADLAKQLKVTVNTGSDLSALVGDGLVVGGADAYVGELAVGDTGTFTVTVEFLDSFVEENNIAHNDLAQGESLSFDLIVHAVQVTEAPVTQ